MNVNNTNENDITDLFDDDAFAEAKSNLEKNDAVYRQNDEFQYRKEQKKREQPTIKQKIARINVVVWLIFEILLLAMMFTPDDVFDAIAQSLPNDAIAQTLGLSIYTVIWLSFIYLSWFSLPEVILCDSDFDLLVRDPKKKFLYPLCIFERAWWNILPNIILATLTWRSMWLLALDENNTFYYAFLWAPIVMFVYNEIIFLEEGDWYDWHNLLWIGNAVALIVAIALR